MFPGFPQGQRTSTKPLAIYVVVSELSQTIKEVTGIQHVSYTIFTGNVFKRFINAFLLCERI
jgi:hypothetical protein